MRIERLKLKVNNYEQKLYLIIDPPTQSSFKRFFPRIISVPAFVWMMETKEEDDESAKWFVKQASETLAFYWTTGNTIFVRDDALSKRVVFHELVHWLIYKWLHNAWGLQEWWDEHCPFLWNFANVALRVGLLKREDLRGGRN